MKKYNLRFINNEETPKKNLKRKFSKIPIVSEPIIIEDNIPRRVDWR